MKGFRKAGLCLAALLLCVAAVCPAAAANGADAGAPAQMPPLAEPGDNWPVRQFDNIWNYYGFLSYLYNMDEGYAYNAAGSLQKLFGFNKAYDVFAPLFGNYYDTLRCTFSYGGRDWMVQLWKGAYMFGQFTGGEVGLYQKPAWLPFGHYFAVSDDDFIGISLDLYYDGELKFTRPMEQRWWQTGYFPNPMWNVWAPRGRSAVTAGLRFGSEEMARAFALSLEAKGFAPADAPPGPGQPDSYCLLGDAVYLSWKGLQENFF